ncbi:MAG: DHH family phosphoesterase [Candidatus Hodarchaeales archaeon]
MNIRDLHFEFLSYLKNLRGEIILIMHPQADPDAVGAAFAIQFFIKEVNPNIEVKVYDPKISNLGQKLLDLLNFEFSCTNTIPQSTPIIFLDYSPVEFKFPQSKTEITIIDHHIIQELSSELLFDFRDDLVNSTTEIIANLYKSCNITLNEEVVKAMLAGIVFDTRRFLYTNDRLFETFSSLLHDFPTAYAEILPLFTNSRSKAERIACIKAAQRMKRFMLNDIQILISSVSSFEAAAARSLIFLGGDIAFVIATREDHSRVSIRSSQNFINNTKISIGKNLIPVIIKKFGGNGGGHDGAAGYNTTVKIELKEFQDFILLILKSLITSKSE